MRAKGVAVSQLASYALARLDVTRMTVVDAMGYARQRGQLETYRGHKYKTNLLRKIGLEIAVNDDFVERTIECLEDVAAAGVVGLHEHVVEDDRYRTTHVHVALDGRDAQGEK